METTDLHSLPEDSQNSPSLSPSCYMWTFFSNFWYSFHSKFFTFSVNFSLIFCFLSLVFEFISMFYVVHSLRKFPTEKKSSFRLLHSSIPISSSFLY